MAVKPGVITTHGEATGLITGMNHLVLVVTDMDESVRFYRDLLGFEVVRTIGTDEGLAIAKSRDDVEDFSVGRMYFFEMGDAQLLALIDVKDSPHADPSIFTSGLWPGAARPPAAPAKMDHVAFNVSTREELVWFQNHLRKHGVEVSDISEPRGGVVVRFVSSIYFFDPSGNPLEIATFDWNDKARWESHRPEDWLADPDPVPSLARPA